MTSTLDIQSANDRRSGHSLDRFGRCDSQGAATSVCLARGDVPTPHERHKERMKTKQASKRKRGRQLRSTGIVRSLASGKQSMKRHKTQSVKGGEYRHCGWCGRRLKVQRKEEISGIALYLNGHKNCPRGAVVIEWLPPN